MAPKRPENVLCNNVIVLRAMWQPSLSYSKKLGPVIPSHKARQTVSFLDALQIPVLTWVLFSPNPTILLGKPLRWKRASALKITQPNNTINL